MPVYRVSGWLYVNASNMDAAEEYLRDGVASGGGDETPDVYCDCGACDIPGWVRDSGKVIERAIEIAVRYGGIDGDHHKAWVIDQIVRVLAGDRYVKIVAEACSGDDGPETYTWDEGIPP